MKNSTPNGLQTTAAFVLLMVPVYVLNLWITAFDAGSNQEERVAAFKDSLPVAIENMVTLSLIQLVFIIGGLVLAARARKNSAGLLKFFNTLLLIGGSLLLAQVLFWLM